jgi:hypothetical protein
VQCMRLKNDHVVRLVGQFTDLLPAFAVQGQLPGARDYIENVLLWTLMNGNRALGIDMPRIT